MYEMRDESETRLGEAIEQLTAAVTKSWQNVSSLLQRSVNNAAAGKVGIADVAACGPQLMRVGIDNFFDLAGVLSDNLALLQGRSVLLDAAERIHVSVPVTIPANSTVGVSASMLRVGLTGPPRSLTCVTIHPTSCGPFDKESPREIAVELDSSHLTPGIYTLTLCLRADDGHVVDEVPVDIPVSDLD